MATIEYIDSLHINENVFELQEDTTIGYLSHYAAPYTGGGEIVVPACARFAAYGPMRGDALYMDLVEENEEFHARMVEQEKADCPQLSNRLMGFSFFITEDEVEKLNLKFVAGSKKRLLEIFQLLRNASVERVHVESPMTENKDDAKDANDAYSLGDPCDLPF